MGNGRDDLRWSPRLSMAKLRRLYESQAQNLLDEDLLEEVGWTLFLRCKDILTVDEAKNGRVACPQCAKQGAATIILRELKTTRAAEDQPITCPACGWQITWRGYASSYDRKQLNAGGATQAFARYVQAYPAAQTAQQKMLEIDRLIHEFHYSYSARPDQPTRPAGVNLIEGKLEAVIAFLNELSGYPAAGGDMAQVREEWQRNLDKFRHIDWRAIVAEQRAQRARREHNE
jgi:predicted RNA-binding Zn-ribbon protein involved in translation (DUF1610 family)